MYDRFGLVLMLNHACNLRCAYCYSGKKFQRPMPEQFGREAIDRATASCLPGGALEVSFFGGEPTLEASLALRLIEHARRECEMRGIGLKLGLTTNGTSADGDAWDLLMLPDMDVCISHDGLPEAHDRHRRFADGGGSSGAVRHTMKRLQQAGKSFRVVMAVRPDTVALLPKGLRFLHALGVKHVDPSLDLWARWDAAAQDRLERALTESTEFWRGHLPEFGVSWFDEKAARLLHAPMEKCARCGFGAGEVAMAPSGRLYPCERLIGSDEPDNPMQLRDSVKRGDFLDLPRLPARSAPQCAECGISEYCDTFCRCSNYIRTGDVQRPDGLLCRLNRVLVRETARELRSLQPDATVRGPSQRDSLARSIIS